MRSTLASCVKSVLINNNDVDRTKRFLISTDSVYASVTYARDVHMYVIVIPRYCGMDPSVNAL
jgi:hypothetical protein